MNTPALVSRMDQRALPQWNDAAPGYMALSSPDDPGRQAGRLAAIFRRYWWLALLLWAVIAIPASIAIYELVPPQYVATGAINVAPVTVNPISGQGQTTAFYTEYLKTQAELMKNPYVLQRATEDVRLKKYDWFQQLPDQVGYLTDNVVVTAVTTTQNIQVSMAHKDATAAKAIVDSVIDAYFRTRNEMEEQNLDKNLEILKGLQAHTDKSLKDGQEQLAKLTTEGNMSWSAEDSKVMADVLASSRQNEGNMESDKLSLESQLTSAKSRALADKDTYIASVTTDTDPQITQWASELIKVQVADNVAASKHATLEHPDRVEYRRQIKTLTAKIDARKKEIQDAAWGFYKAGFELERAKKIAEIESDLAGVNQRITSLQKRIADQEAVARDLGNKMQPIAVLRDQIADDKDALKRYTDRIEEIENQNRAPGRVTSVAPTVLPRTPTVDKRRNFILASNGLGLLFGLGALVTMMKLRDKIDHAEDLPNNFQPLVVGTVSHAGSSARGLQGRMRRKILGEEMRLLHANLLPPGPVQRRIMMVTSPTPGNGKTSIASQLALSLAKSGLEVLLIDADLRKRDLSTMFDVGFRAGLADLLQGKPPELIRPIELLPNLRLMGAGTKLERNPVELFQRKHFHENLNLLHDKFDCIVVDTPPALVVADARLIARSCDEVLCVVRAQVSSPKDVNQTLDALSRITGKTPKIILNGVEHHQSYYKYKFAYTHDEAESNAGTEAAVS